METGIHIKCIRVRNFRCLQEVEVNLSGMTVLIGENNGGKTSFLQAVYAAIGSGQRHIGEADIFLADGERKPPRDRQITVDLLIVPVDKHLKETGAFPEGSPWLELWGSGVSQDEDDDDFVGIRMTLSWDAIKGDYFVERRFLNEWKTDLNEMMEAELAQHVSQVRSDQLAPLALYFLDAKRDAASELRTQGSIWNRMLADHGLEDDDIDAIELKLSEINELLVNKSGVLKHVQEHLNDVSRIMNCDDDTVSVNPVARKLRDLNRGTDVVLATRGAPQFPLSQQGMGTRSLTSVLMFRAYMAWRQQNDAQAALHPFVAVEEPEAHLHPHAQRSLFRQLSELPGQRLISTHSPYVCSQTAITSFVHFSKEGEESRVASFGANDVDELTPEDLRAINRRVMQTRGEILFSRCVVLFEGETEEQALPRFAERYWGKHPNDYGISFISVDGHGNYLPFLRLVCRFRIPWVVFSDGEVEAVESLDCALRKVSLPKSEENDRCVVLPDGKCFEEYMTTPTSVGVLSEMIAEFQIEKKKVVDERGVAGIKTAWSRKSDAELLAELLNRKTAYGARISDAYGRLNDEEQQTPQEIKDMLDLALGRDEEEVNGA